MSYTSLILAVLAAMAHAAWNLLAKRAAMVGPMFVFAYGLAATILYAPWVIWVLAHDGMVWSWPVVLCILASSMLHLGYSLCLQRGYQVADLSVVYPIARGTGPLLSTMGAFTLLSEPATTTGIAGMLCVVGGVLLIATQGRLGMFRQAQAWIGVRWGVVIGLFIAAYTVVDAYGVKMLLIMPVLFDWFTCATRTLMMTPHVLRRRAQYWPAMAPCHCGGRPVASGLHPGAVRAAQWRAAQPGCPGPRNVDDAGHTGGNVPATGKSRHRPTGWLPGHPGRRGAAGVELTPAQNPPAAPSHISAGIMAPQTATSSTSMILALVLNTCAAACVAAPLSSACA